MVQSPQITLKIVVVVHFILTIWASMIGFMGISYVYMNAFIIAFGCWAIFNPESPDAALNFLSLHVGSILMDIIFLGIFTSIGHDIYQDSQVHLFRFCLAMAIINLILKPFTSFIVFRIYQDRGGQYGEFNIPGVPRFGGGGNAGAGYENIDNVPSNNVETASPHNYSPSPASQ